MPVLKFAAPAIFVYLDSLVVNGAKGAAKKRKVVIIERRSDDYLQSTWSSRGIWTRYSKAKRCIESRGGDFRYV